MSVAMRAALHAGQHIAAGMLQRHINIFSQARMSRERLQHFLCDAIGIRIEKAYPQNVFDARQLFQQQRKAIAQPQVFAVGSGVLADQCDFAGSAGRQIFRFAHHGFKAPAAKRAAQLWNDAEGAGVVAALSNFDVGLMLWSGQDARGQVVIQKCRRLRGKNFQVAFHGFDDAFDFPGTHDGVHFRNLFQNLLAEALHQASGNNQFLSGAEFLVLSHFQNRVDGFFLRGFNKTAGVDHEDLRIIGARREFVAFAGKNAHHHLAVDEVFGAAQGDETDFGHS